MGGIPSANTDRQSTGLNGRDAKGMGSLVDNRWQGCREHRFRVAIIKHNPPVNGLSGPVAWNERSAFWIHERQPRSVFGNRHLLELMTLNRQARCLRNGRNNGWAEPVMEATAPDKPWRDP